MVAPAPAASPSLLPRLPPDLRRPPARLARAADAVPRTTGPATRVDPVRHSHMYRYPGPRAPNADPVTPWWGEPEADQNPRGSDAPATAGRTTRVRGAGAVGQRLDPSRFRR